MQQIQATMAERGWSCKVWSLIWASAVQRISEILSYSFHDWHKKTLYRLSPSCSCSSGCTDRLWPAVQIHAPQSKDSRYNMTRDTVLLLVCFYFSCSLLYFTILPLRKCKPLRLVHKAGKHQEAYLCSKTYAQTSAQRTHKRTRHKMLTSNAYSSVHMRTHAAFTDLQAAQQVKTVVMA